MPLTHIPPLLRPAVSDSRGVQVPHWTTLPAAGSLSLPESYAVPTAGWQQPYPTQGTQYHVTTVTQTAQTRNSSAQVIVYGGQEAFSHSIFSQPY